VQIDSKVFYSATVPILVELSKEVEMVAVIHDEEPPVPNVARAPVLVGIDGSPASEAATAIAFEEASQRGVGLVALHAWTDLRVSEYPDFNWDAELSEEEETLAERLAGWQERYPAVGIRRKIEISEPANRARIPVIVARQS
jgi:nucleotide-binding universal stress UspA family protein